MTIRRGFVRVGDGNVHYRTAGAGPVLVLLHDSPRSSSLHAPLLAAFSDRYEVIALDTPGYGESDPLAGEPTIADLADALARTLDALHVERALFYGFHTSSKILLAFAERHPDRVALAVLDGLSIPLGAPDETFVSTYMRPFALDGDGSWLAREWTRVLDTWRWFPWFRPEASTRMPIDQPAIDALHAYALDYFLAGEGYPSAYAAAMRHDPRDHLRRVAAPVLIVAREDDVLHPHLERVPADRASGVKVQSLPADADRWREALAGMFACGGGKAKAKARVEVGSRFYVDFAGGQTHVRRLGPLEGSPILYVHDAPGGSAGEGAWLSALATHAPVLAIDLPGCGGSDPLEDATFAGYVAWLGEVCRALDLYRPAIIAEGVSSVFAMALAACAPDLVGALIVDGAPVLTSEVRARWMREAGASLAPERSGAHWLRVWHILRDREAHYPWWDGSARAIRHREPNIHPQRLRQMTLDVMRRPEAWSAALRAALEVDLVDVAPAVKTSVLFPLDPDDPRQAGGEVLAKLTPRGTVTLRAASIEARAAQYTAFLAGEDFQGRMPL